MNQHVFHRFLFLIFLTPFLSLPTLASADFLKPYLYVTPGTEISLDLLGEGNQFKTIQLGQGGRLFVTDDMRIFADEIFLDRGARLHTLGHHLELFCRLFDATRHLQLAVPLSFSGEGDPFSYLGGVDTRTYESVQHGARGRSGAEIHAESGSSALNGRNTEVPGDNTGEVRSAQDGIRGASGENGESGKDAGNLRLVVADFFGGAFVTRGGNGGNGGDGQAGGRGGNGIDWYISFGMEQARLHRRLLDSGSGGAGGAAGAGGDGGRGGNVDLLILQDNTAGDARFITIDVAGGNGGEAGEPGVGGPPGDVGRNTNEGFIRGDNGEVIAGVFGTAGCQGERASQGRVRGHGRSHTRPMTLEQWEELWYGER